VNVHFNKAVLPVLLTVVFCTTLALAEFQGVIYLDNKKIEKGYFIYQGRTPYITIAPVALALGRTVVLEAEGKRAVCDQTVIDVTPLAGRDELILPLKQVESLLELTGDISGSGRSLYLYTAQGLIHAEEEAARHPQPTPSPAPSSSPPPGASSGAPGGPPPGGPGGPPPGGPGGPGSGGSSASQPPQGGGSMAPAAMGGGSSQNPPPPPQAPGSDRGGDPVAGAVTPGGRDGDSSNDLSSVVITSYGAYTNPGSKAVELRVTVANRGQKPVTNVKVLMRVLRGVRDVVLEKSMVIEQLGPGRSDTMKQSLGYAAERNLSGDQNFSIWFSAGGAMMTVRVNMECTLVK